MNKYNLLAPIRHPRRYYQRHKKLEPYENKFNRDFSANKPNQKWMTDISYLFTKQGVLYLSMIKDLYDNFVVSFDMATGQDTQLVLWTIGKAKNEVADKLMLHSDQGFQYTSLKYFNLTKEYFILPSMARAGTPRDNACTENFFGILKSECIYREKLETYEQAENIINDYISFYNFERI